MIDVYLINHVNTEKLTTGPMIPSGTNSSPVARVIDPVIKTLTTEPMIPSGNNNPPVARVIDPVIETLTTGIRSLWEEVN